MQLGDDLIAGLRIALEAAAAGESLHHCLERATDAAGHGLFGLGHEVEHEPQRAERGDLGEQRAPLVAGQVHREALGDHERRPRANERRELGGRDIAGDELEVTAPSTAWPAAVRSSSSRFFATIAGRSSPDVRTSGSRFSVAPRRDRPAASSSTPVAPAAR